MGSFSDEIKTFFRLEEEFFKLGFLLYLEKDDNDYVYRLKTDGSDEVLTFPTFMDAASYYNSIKKLH